MPYSDDLKEQVRDLWAEGVPVSEMARELGIARRTIQRWKNCEWWLDMEPPPPPLAASDAAIAEAKAAIDRHRLFMERRKEEARQSLLMEKRKEEARQRLRIEQKVDEARQRVLRLEQRERERKGQKPLKTVGSVYFVEETSSGCVKIGYSTNLAARLVALQTSCASELVLLGSVPGTPETERYFHSIFADCLVRGEWFQMTPKLRSFVDLLITQTPL